MTLDLIKEIEFDNLFSFKYSDRLGTLAEKMDGKVEEREKAARLSELQRVQREITLKKNQSMETQEVRVLVEGKSKKGGQLTGRTPTNKVVNFCSDNGMIGMIVNVRITRAFFNSLRGETSFFSGVKD
ncbi:MAG: TRAM domain-containing protein [Pseudomonadota bacterium]